jgi:nicotinate-nucleotide adenylyltransferase
MQSLKIGLYGGSFDPIHHGHVGVATAAVEQIGLDQLIWIPSFQSHDAKSIHADAEDRLAMCELITKQQPYFAASPFEIEQGRAVYTMETLQYFKQLFPEAELYWIMGADQALNLNTWQNPEAVLQLAKIVIYPRVDMDMPVKLDIQGKSYPVITDPDHFDNAHIIYLQHQPLEMCASSAIKQQMTNKSSMVESIPQPILTYIQTHRLYQEN